MKIRNNNLIITVDLDEWYHAGRFLTGQQKNCIPDMKETFLKLYKTDHPIGELIEPTHQLLNLFKKYDVQVTFFVLGEVAEWYRELLKEIVDDGHEIACHGMHHVDMTVLGPKLFSDQIKKSSNILRQITKYQPIGYRAPNLVLHEWAIPILEDQGFFYDSTVIPSFSISGKYKGWIHAPTQPYHPSYQNIALKGDAKIVELPITSFPIIKLPAGSGFALRIFGYNWTKFALNYNIKRGNGLLYFHPYEISEKPNLEGPIIKSRIFKMRIGKWMYNSLERILSKYNEKIIPASIFIKEC
jgi:hypothetical protein